MSTVTTFSAASKPQTWAIFCAVKVGVVDAGLTYEQASEILDLAQTDKVAARERAIALGGVVKGNLPGDTRKHQELFDRAWAAGVAAGEACTPVPMIVYEPANLMSSLTGGPDGGIKPNTPVFTVPSGSCGFAWVNVNPGNSSFARWLTKNGHARKHYHGGVNINIRGYGQSIEKKSAHAGAMTNVFREAGITAYSMSRDD